MRARPILGFGIIFMLSAIVAAIWLFGTPNLTRRLDKEAPEPDLSSWADFAAARRALPEAGEQVSLVLVGDIMLSRNVAAKIRDHNNSNYPFAKTAEFLKDSDITFANLENPLIEGRAIKPNQMTLRADPEQAQVLKSTGFDVLSLANNHIADFDDAGINTTIKALDDADIAHVGAGSDALTAGAPVYIARKGLTFAFLAYTFADGADPQNEAGKNKPGVAFMRSPRLAKAIREARLDADFIIVSMHAGSEYADEQNQTQLVFAHKAIDNGADLVVGHHPHVVQPLEKYRGKYILYSLGNFVFDQTVFDTNKGLAVEIIFDKSGIRRLEPRPVIIRNCQPQVVKGPISNDVLARLKYPLANSCAFSWSESKNSFDTFSRNSIACGSASLKKMAKSEEADLDKNSNPELYSLRNGELMVTQNGRELWKSPNDWWVDGFEFADSNNDGVRDLNMSVWKPGNFGTFRPFWNKSNDMSVKNHFFVFDLAEGKLKPVWNSSNLDAPICEFKLVDVDKDNANELVVIEGDYEDWPLCIGYDVAIWRWHQFSFENIWKSKKGRYHRLDIENIDDEPCIIVDVL